MDEEPNIEKMLGNLEKIYEEAVDVLAHMGEKWQGDSQTDIFARAIIGQARPLLETIMQIREKPDLHPVMIAIFMSQMDATLENCRLVDAFSDTLSSDYTERFDDL